MPLDPRILCVRDKETNQVHREIFYWNEEKHEFITEIIFGDYDDAEGTLNYLLKEGMEVFDYSFPFVITR